MDLPAVSAAEVWTLMLEITQGVLPSRDAHLSLRVQSLNWGPICHRVGMTNCTHS